MRWLTLTHTQRWHAHHHSAGTGPVYQGRFKAFPVQSDAHFLTVARYIERNALRAALVERAEEWCWSSLWHRHRGTGISRILSEWPVPCPGDWIERVNEPDNPAELESLRTCVQRGRPFGEDAWQLATVKRLGLDSTIRPRGRPRRIDEEA